MNKEELVKQTQDHADKEGFEVQADPSRLNMIFEGLLRNQEKHGDIYCPCRRVSGNKEEDKKIVCPCIYHKDEVKQDGHCKCFLFFKKGSQE